MGGLYNPPTPASIGAVPTTRNLTAGANMTGGGDLSADRTFNASGGGGGSSLIFTQVPTNMAGIDSGANACMGNIVFLKDAITVSYLEVTFSNSTIGHSYNGFIGLINTANRTIISTVAATPSFVTTATGAQTVRFTFATPVALAAGAYIFGFVKNNVLGTTSCGCMYGTTSTIYPNLPYDGGAMYVAFGTSISAATYATNSSTPTGIAVTSFAANASYAIGMGFTL